MTTKNIITVPSESTYGIFSSNNEDYHIKQLHYSWRSYKLKQHFTIKGKVTNPRTTGSITFRKTQDEHILNYVLIEYLGCTSHVKCPVKIKFKHYCTPQQIMMCDITYVKENIHSNESSTQQKKKKLHNPQVKEFVETTVDSTPQYAPNLLLIESERKFGNEKVPPLKIVQNWKRNFMKRKRMKRNDIQMIEDEFSDHSNFVKLYKKNQDFVVIFRSNNYSFKIFSDTVQKIGSVVGLDAQYKQNTKYYPLYILCSQNSNFNTIPGFIFMASANTVFLISKALEEIKLYLIQRGIIFNSTIMIDKCKIEKEAADQNKIPTILCEFHIIKLIKPIWNKYIINKDTQNEILLNFKEIARSTSVDIRNINIFSFNSICISNKLFEFQNYMHENWLSEEWIETWTDLLRPGNREGLYNTNNASESFFRNLLHTHCLSRRHSPHTVIQIIVEQVFSRVDQQLQVARPNTNPSLRDIEKAQKKGNKLFEEKNVSKVSNYKYLVFDGSRIQTVRNCNSCDCFKFVWHGKSCAHIRAVTLQIASETGKVKKVKPGRKRSTRINEYKSFVNSQLKQDQEIFYSDNDSQTDDDSQIDDYNHTKNTKSNSYDSLTEMDLHIPTQIDSANEYPEQSINFSDFDTFPNDDAFWENQETSPKPDSETDCINENVEISHDHNLIPPCSQATNSITENVEISHDNKLATSSKTIFSADNDWRPPHKLNTSALKEELTRHNISYEGGGRNDLLAIYEANYNIWYYNRKSNQ